jgi:hypothetical protein
MEADKLEYIFRIPEGEHLLLNLIREDHRKAVFELTDRFGIREMLTDESRDHTCMISFLYYFGVLTVDDITDEGEIALKVPYLVIRKLYAEKIQTMLLPDPRDRDDSITAGKQMNSEE